MRAGVGLVSVVVGLAAGLAPGLHVPCDFAAFWSAAVLFAGGQNPYDPALLLPLQDAAGFRAGYAINIINPPWVLPLLAPLAALPVKAAFAVWLGVQLALVLVAAGWLWRAAGGAADRGWVAAAVAVAFAPTFLLLTGGQLTGVALFGLAGFVRFRPAEPILAGCLGALTAVKPHLFGLFAVALVIDAARSGDGRRAALGGAVVLLFASGVAVAVRPAVFDEYRAALAAPSSAAFRGMADYPAPVAGVMLRDALPDRPGWAAFLPLGVATVTVVVIARRLPPTDRWTGLLPYLVAGSLVVAPYGAWWYDMVLLLPLLVLAAVRAGGAALVAFVLLDLAVMALYAGRDRLTPLFALVPPVTMLGCFLLSRAAPPEADR